MSAGKMTRLFFILVLAAIQGCGIYQSKRQVETLPLRAEQIGYKQIHERVIAPSCVHCHNVNNPKGGIALDSYAQVRANLALIKEVTLDTRVMPPRKPLSDADIKLLADWIAEGTPENADGASAPAPEPTPIATPASVATTVFDWILPSASAADFASQKAQIEFFVIGKPSMLKIHGTSDDLTGKVSTGPKGASGKLVAKMDRFTTGGMALRDKHLKEKILEPEKFPTSEITFTDIPVNADGAPFKGKLKFHGKEKDVEGTAKITDKSATNKSLAYDVTFKIKQSDFDIEPPKYLGMTMQDDVDVTVKGEAKP